MVDVSFPPPGSEPAFTDAWLPTAPRALVLVLHGGAERTHRPVDGRSLSWRRGRALARHLGGRLADDDIGVALLRYRVKGWNAGAGPLPSPVPDARWALDALAQRHGVPVAILGHSMGARTGVAVADHPSVRGVVALAPWLPPEDSVTPLAGKILHAAHGSRDKITSAKATRRFVDRASAVAAEATFTDMGPVGHYLLSRVNAWHDVAADGVLDVLGS